MTVRFQSACFVGDLLKSTLHLYKPVPWEEVISRSQVFAFSFIMKVKDVLVTGVDRVLGIVSSCSNTCVCWNQFWYNKSCGAGADVHACSGGFIKQCLVGVDPGYTHRSVSYIKSGKINWIVSSDLFFIREGVIQKKSVWNFTLDLKKIFFASFRRYTKKIPKGVRPPPLWGISHTFFP